MVSRNRPLQSKTCDFSSGDRLAAAVEDHSHSIITKALKALPLLVFIRFTPPNTVTDTVYRRTLSIHAGFRAMTKI
jgi:hypothetical protein